jgi:hypothetical protein
MAYAEKELIKELTEEIFRIKSEKKRKKIFNLLQKLLDSISHEGSERAKKFRQERAELFKKISQGYQIPIILYREDVEKIKEYFLLIMQMQDVYVTSPREDLEISSVSTKVNRKEWMCNECSKIMKMRENRLIIFVTYSTTFGDFQRLHIFSFCCEKCVEKFTNTLDEKISQAKKDIGAMNKNSEERREFWKIPEDTPHCGREFDPEDD